MFCTNCGCQNTSGNFCVQCGAPLNNVQQPAMVNQPVQPQVPIQQPMGQNGTMGQLVLKRDSALIGFAVDIHITVNGAPYQLSAGKSVVLDLVPGTYRITYKVWCRKEKEVIINVFAGNQYILDFVYDALWGGFKLGKYSKLQ